GFNAAVTRTNRCLAQQGQRTDLRGSSNVRTTAQFAAPGAVDLHHAYGVAVLFTEQAHGTGGLSLGQRHDIGKYLVVATDGKVYNFFDLIAGSCGQRLGPREVKAQVAGLVVGT